MVSKERILIVEDERIIAEEIRYMLSSLGYVVTGIAATGVDAIKAAGETSPDFVLMDIRLKGDMDGIEAAGIILEHYNIPAIYLTAYSDETTIQRAKLTRPLGYIIKPLDRIQVNSVIEVALYRYRREKILAESERWLTATLKTIENGIIAIGSAGGEIHYMNPAACMLTGVSAAQACRKPIDDFVSMADIHTHQPVHGFFRNVIAGSPAGQVRGSAILISGDGYEIPVSYALSPIKDETRQGPGYIVVLRDISRRLKMENMLQSSESQNRTLAESPCEGIVSMDAEHRIQFVNQRMTEILGQPREHLIGQQVFRFMSADSAQDLRSRLHAAKDSPVIRCESGLLRSDGTGFWAMLTINRMTDLEGKYAGAVAMVYDISGRKSVETRLSEARAQTEMYLDLIEKEIGKMNDIFRGYLDTSDELVD